MDKPIPEAVTDFQLMALLDWHGKDGTRKGELTTAALLELHQTRALTAAQQQGQAVAWLGSNPRTGVPATCAYKPSPTVMREFNMRPLVYADTAPPSAPVGVEGFSEWAAQSIVAVNRATAAANALAQQPAAVDDDDDDEEPGEPCESGLLDCGPAVAWDYEGIGACERCARELGWVATQHQEPTT